MQSFVLVVHSLRTKHPGPFLLKLTAPSTQTLSSPQPTHQDLEPLLIEAEAGASGLLQVLVLKEGLQKAFGAVAIVFSGAERKEALLSHCEDAGAGLVFSVASQRTKEVCARIDQWADRFVGLADGMARGAAPGKPEPRVDLERKLEVYSCKLGDILNVIMDHGDPELKERIDKIMSS
jgi:hypothetical protein